MGNKRVLEKRFAKGKQGGNGMEQEKTDGQTRPDTADAAEAELLALLPRLPDPNTLTQAQKARERKQLRDRLKALNAVPRSDWHREFENLLQI